MRHRPYGNTFITVYQPVAGWKAVCMCWDEECGEYLPEQTAYFAHKNKEKAIAEGKEWAEAEEIEFVL